MTKHVTISDGKINSMRLHRRPYRDNTQRKKETTKYPACQ